MGVVNKFAEDAAGNTSETLLQAYAQATEASGNAMLSDFGATAGGAATETRVDLRIAPDNDPPDGSPDTGSEVTVDRIELPTAGTILKSYDSPIRVTISQWFGTYFQQATIGRVSSTISGDTMKTGTQADISDI
jgi:hypothetical protein